jgi:hypothetical protein
MKVKKGINEGAIHIIFYAGLWMLLGLFIAKRSV